MNTQKESQILAAIRKSEPKKKRVTFFISANAKSGLAAWCEKHGVTESSAIEEMIRATVPEKFFKQED